MSDGVGAASFSEELRVMREPIVSSFDLHCLRGSFAKHFLDWDESVSANDTAKAKKARSAILTAAREGLANDPAAQLPGLYVFFDTRVTSIAAVRYIGIARGRHRPIGGRIVDRLRDDSGLDTALDNVSEEEFRQIVSRRLTVALPATGQNYVNKHYAVARLFRESTQAILVGGEFARAEIVLAERSLIGAAVASGARPHNRSHLRHDKRARGEAAQIAARAILACEHAGLKREAAEQWADRALVR